jgi:hypothetical protein
MFFTNAEYFSHIFASLFYFSHTAILLSSLVVAHLFQSVLEIKYMPMRGELAFVQANLISECETDSCIMEVLPLKKFDFPSPFLPMMILI